MTQQPAGTTRGGEGDTGHNKRTRRGDTTTSRCDELKRGWRKDRTTRGNMTTSCGDKKTKGWRNERTARGNVTAS